MEDLKEVKASIIDEVSARGFHRSMFSKRRKLIAHDYYEEAKHNNHMMTSTDHETCTPSYQLSRRNLYESTKYEATEIAEQVLNTTCIIVRSAKSSPKKKNISQYEKVLNMYEDDRFEKDVFLGRLESTAENVEAFYMRLLEESQLDEVAPIQFDEFLDAMNLRCIEQIYDDQGLEILDLIRENPIMVLIRILTRLDEKVEAYKKDIASMKIYRC